MKNNEIKEDMKKSKTVIEDIIGKEIFSYRAPSFSLRYENRKAFYQNLAEVGYKYSSSVSNSRSDYGGDAKFSNTIKKLILMMISL